MNKKDKEMEYQKGIDELYNKTQLFGRIDFVKVMFDLTEELKLNLKKLEKIKDKLYCWGEVINPELQEELLSIIGGNNE